MTKSGHKGQNNKLRSCARHEPGYGMMKKLMIAIALVAGFAVADITTSTTGLTATCMAAAPNNGTYMRTGYYVSVYCETGNPKGSFAVYLHNGQRYIDFHNTWICIQGKSRFAYCGNWYVIR